MKLETTNESLFLEVDEAKRFLLLIAHCGFSSQRCQRSGCADLACVDVRCARRIRAFRHIRHADVGNSQTHDAALRGRLLGQQTWPMRKWFTWFTCRGPCGGIVVPESAVDPNLSFRTLCREQGQPIVARSRILPFLIIPIRGHLKFASAVGGQWWQSIPFSLRRSRVARACCARHSVPRLRAFLKIRPSLR